MTIEGLPEAEVDIDPALIGALLEAQHADLARLPIVDAGSGWDNKLYRLGEDLAVRLPRRAAAASLIEQEQRWLPQLAPRLPLPVPVPVRIGRPGCGYPWSWSVVPWRSGETADIAAVHDPVSAATELGRFLCALHQPAPADAPRNPLRAVPLGDRDDVVHKCVRQLDRLVDGDRIIDVWRRLVERRRGRARRFGRTVTFTRAICWSAKGVSRRLSISAISARETLRPICRLPGCGSPPPRGQYSRRRPAGRPTGATTRRGRALAAGRSHWGSPTSPGPETVRSSVGSAAPQSTRLFATTSVFCDPRLSRGALRRPGG